MSNWIAAILATAAFFAACEFVSPQPANDAPTKHSTAVSV